MEKDIEFTEKDLGTCVLMSGEVKYSQCIHIREKDLEKIRPSAQSRIANELRYQIWGKKNKEIIDWMNEELDTALSFPAIPFDVYVSINKFRLELKNKLLGK